MAIQNRCKHSGCRCNANQGQEGFCSDACKQHRESGGKCQCGHPECR